MLSDYFLKKTSTQEFDKHIFDLFLKMKNKKILIYGDGEGFKALNKKYNFKDNFNIVALADKKYENKSLCNKNSDFKTIAPNEIKNYNYDYIIVSNEYNFPIVFFLINDLKIDENKIISIFSDDIPHERINIIYLEKNNFKDRLKKIKQKLNNGSIVIYGAGDLFNTIQKYYDLSGLNIIGISDKSFKKYSTENQDTIFGYNIILPKDIEAHKPDYILISTKLYTVIMEEIYTKLSNKNKIKIIPLLKKSIFELIKEIFC